MSTRNLHALASWLLPCSVLIVMKFYRNNFVILKQMKDLDLDDLESSMSRLTGHHISHALSKRWGGKCLGVHLLVAISYSYEFQYLGCCCRRSRRSSRQIRMCSMVSSLTGEPCTPHSCFFEASLCATLMNPASDQNVGCKPRQIVTVQQYGFINSSSWGSKNCSTAMLSPLNIFLLLRRQNCVDDYAFRTWWD